MSSKTIRVQEKTLKKLEGLKIHQRQTIDEIIRELIAKHEAWTKLEL